MLASDRPYVTEREFLERPEHLACAELVDGELVVSPSPSRGHQRACANVFRQVDAWIGGHRPALETLFAPLDVRLGPDRILQPDVVVLPRVDEASAPVLEVPRLCVEVLSPNRVGFDRHTKRLMYAQAGVPEYWVVDPVSRQVEVFHGPGLHDRVLRADRVESLTLEGLTVTL